jgi:hypothetical protein
MDTANQQLRLNIDGRWTASEMAASIQEINFLYDLRLYLNSLEDAEPYWDELYHFFPPFRHWAKRRGILPAPFFFPQAPFLYRPDDVRQFSKLYFPEHVLRISRIEYASPGAKDFLGIGEILKQIRIFVQYLIELPQNREKQNLNNAAQRIQNARDLVKLRFEFSRANVEIDNIDNDGLAALVDDNTRTILKLVEEKKITSSIMLESNSETAE